MMSEIPGPSPGWERREPPDYELDPPYSDDKPEDDDPYYNAFTYLSTAMDRGLLELLKTAEHVEGTSEIDLFKNAVVTSTEGELKFAVPPRIVESAENGRWVLNVRGKRQWFKERMDYGDMRFLKTGQGIWVPHLYAFEAIGGDNMPQIRDRERLRVDIWLTRLPGGGESPYPMMVHVDTRNGQYEATEDIITSFGGNEIYFEEFEHIDGTLVAYNVVEPEVKRLTIAEYLSKLEANGETEKAKRFLSGTKELPPECIAPEVVIQTERSEMSGRPFGSLWIPVEMLRQGTVYAKISFPNFQ